MRCVFCGEEFTDGWSQPSRTRRASERVVFHSWCYEKNAKKSREDYLRRIGNKPIDTGADE